MSPACKMLARLCVLLAAGWAAAQAEPSTSPNSAVMPSVSYLDLQYSRNPSEKAIAAVFNKVSLGESTTATPRTSPTPRPTRRPPPPPPPPTTSRVPLLDSNRLPMPPYSTEAPPVTRGRFKPPLPAEYQNPFADKPILRGSQSEGGAGEHRRHNKRPPVHLPKAPPEQERIPIRPPDLPVYNKQKPLNTPTRGTNGSKDVTNGPRQVDPHNETEFNFVPILQNPAVTRILSGSNGRKDPTPDELDRRLNSTRVQFDLNKMFPMEYSTTTTSTTSSTTTTTTVSPEVETEEEEEELIELSEVPELGNEIEPESEEPPAELTAERDDYELRVWGVAWDVHVYMMGGLFALLTLVCIINWVRRRGRVLSRPYFHSANSLLLVVGAARTLFLLHDAYNLHGGYPNWVAPALLHMPLPMISLAFGLQFLFLVRFTRTRLLPERTNRPALAAASTLAIVHVVACLGLQLAAGCATQPRSLLLANQWLALAWALSLAAIFLAAFPRLSRALDTLNPMFSTRRHVPAASLGLVLRSLLAVAMLLLLLVCVHLYGLLGVAGLYGDQPPRPWPWWGFQFSVRVIEVSVCLLMAFVASLRVDPPVVGAKKNPATGIFALCKDKPTQEAKQPAPADLIYPAVCGANYAVQKKLYEDPYQLRTLVAAEPPRPLRFPQNRRLPEPAQDNPERPSSMLFAEEGFVRFRTSNDPEQPMEEVLHQSLTRPGREGPVPAARPPMPQPRWAAAPPAHCHHPSDSDFASTDESSPSCSSSSGSSHHHHPHHHHLRTPLHRHHASDDVTPDSAVGSDIYSKNGDCPVDKLWCEELLSRSIIDRLTALHHHGVAGYTPLAYGRALAASAVSPGHHLPPLGPDHYNLEAIYARPDDESAV